MRTKTLALVQERKGQRQHKWTIVSTDRSTTVEHRIDGRISDTIDARDMVSAIAVVKTWAREVASRANSRALLYDGEFVRLAQPAQTGAD